MVTRYLIHNLMIKIIKEILLVLSETSKAVGTRDVSEQTLTQIQQGVYDIATYTQKLFSVVTKDAEIEGENKSRFDQIESVLKNIEEQLEQNRAEPKLRRDLDLVQEELDKAELEEYEELKSDWRIKTHLKEVIEKLDVYKKGYLQFYATKRDELAVLLREIALHMTAVLKLLDVDIREDREILSHVKHVHELFREATQPGFAKVWEETGQKGFVQDVVRKVEEEIKQETSGDSE